MIWSKDEIDILIENFPKNGSKYCSQLLNKSKSSIQQKANKLGLFVDRDIVRKNMSKNTINIDDYRNVSDKKIAYILGLIWTDGTVTFANNKSKTPVIKHTCVKYDSEIITKIFNELNWRHFYSENKKSIGKNTMSAHWLSSRELGNLLIENNFRDKSKGTFIYELFEDEKLISHFIRGIFDGDGSFCISEIKNTKYKQFNIAFSSTHDQDWSYLINILNKLNVKFKDRICFDKLGKSSQLNIFNSKSIHHFCDFIYNDSEHLRLERKYIKYQQFLEYKSKYNSI
jgi:hypothetical protein